MSKRHNRKRTRSRPRHRDAGKAHSNYPRTLSMDTDGSFTSTESFSQSPYFPITNRSADHWQQTYSAWQARLRHEQEREQALEAQRLRFFGGVAGDEEPISLLEPMLKVVTDLFDGEIDYEDPV